MAVSVVAQLIYCQRETARWEMGASRRRHEDQASPRAGLAHGSLKIGEINFAVLRTLSQLSKETRYPGVCVGGCGGNCLARPASCRPWRTS